MAAMGGRGEESRHAHGCVSVHSKAGWVCGDLSSMRGSGSNSSADREVQACHCLYAKQYVKLRPQFSGTYRVIFCRHATMTLIGITYQVWSYENLTLTNVI